MSEQGEALRGLRTIPVDREIAESLLDILGDQSVRVDRLNELVCSDPVLLLEMVAAANGLKNVSGGKAILDSKSALLALGLERIRQIVQELAETTPHYDGDRAFWLKATKQKCRKSAAVASLIAKIVRPESAMECFTIGALAFWGDLLALAKLGDRFVGMLEDGMRRSKLRYQLAKDFNYSLEDEAIDYFRQRTLPNAIPLALDPESAKLLPNIQALKEICLSGVEFVDAYLEDRLDRLAPGVSIPPKSYRRMLALTEARYEALYESIAAYLEKGAFVDLPTQENEDISAEGIPEERGSDLDLLVEGGVENPAVESPDALPFDEFEEDVPETDVVELGFGGADDTPFDQKFVKPVEMVPRRKYVSKSDQAMPKFASMFEDTESVEDLLKRLLDMIIGQPPFECAALLIVSPEEKKAMPILVRGRKMPDGVTKVFDVKDPLSPLLNAKSKVVSYSPKKKGDTPFGCGNYALSPIDVPYKRPVLLYADCGEGKILTFEGRRLFRKVVGLLNAVLPKMEGALPMEFEDTLTSS